MSTAILTFQVSPGQDIEFPLNADAVTLGRDPTNAIVIQNSWISSHHARFTRKSDGSFEVHDLDSQNGIEVNGRRIVRCALRDGDKVAFGQVDAKYIVPESDASREAKTASIPVEKGTGGQQTIRGGNRAELERSLEHLRDEQAALTAEVEKLQGIKGKLASASEHEPAIGSLQAELDALHKEIVEATAARDEITEESSRTEKLLSGLTGKVAEASKEKAALGEAIAAKVRAEAALKTIESKVHESENLRDSIQGELSTLEEKHKSLSEEVGQKTEENTTLGTQKSELEKELMLLKANCEKQKTAHETAETKFAELQAIISDAEASSADAKQIQADLTALHVQKTGLEKEVNSLKESAGTLKEEAKKADSLRSEVSALESTLADLAPKESELAEITAKLAITERGFTSVVSQNAEAEKTLSETKEALDAAQKELSSAKADAKAAEESKDEMEKSAVSLKERVAELEDQKETLEAAQDLEWGTVHILAKNLIRRIDLLDDLLAAVRADAKDKDFVDQLVALREALLDILREHSVEAFHFPQGTPIDLKTRKRILILGGAEDSPSGKEIASTVRPGYFCSNGDIGSETLLRKAEVKIA
ncbi:FHA domain-containing protein [Verrucomicrobiales bacterium]|nr:FHA domain-containing protein [Verrucomicrobiales bacterium]